jgi:hypothetical protein
MRELEYQARHSLTEYAKARTCSLGGVGTGNVVRLNGDAFIVTAKHVADTFYELKRPQVIFYGNLKIGASQTIYSAGTDDTLDIALITLHDLDAAVSAYEYDDFEFIDDFRRYDFNGVDLQVFGFPEQLQHETKSDLFYSWMSYVTIVCSDQPATSDFLFCQYPMKLPVQDSRRLDKATLPAARGLSGAFILKLRLHDSHSVWSPTSAKVIAMQIAWDKRSYIKCSNIAHLKTLLPQSHVKPAGVP